jgi:hypothetical protein
LRKLINGEIAEDLEFPIDLIIHTKCPSKWVLIDMETGQEYVGMKIPNEYGQWLRVKDK